MEFDLTAPEGKGLKRDGLIAKVTIKAADDVVEQRILTEAVFFIIQRLKAADFSKNLSREVPDAEK